MAKISCRVLPSVMSYTNWPRRDGHQELPFFALLKLADLGQSLLPLSAFLRVAADLVQGFPVTTWGQRSIQEAETSRNLLQAQFEHLTWSHPRFWISLLYWHALYILQVWCLAYRATWKQGFAQDLIDAPNGFCTTGIYLLPKRNHGMLGLDFKWLSISVNLFTLSLHILICHAAFHASTWSCHCFAVVLGVLAVALHPAKTLGQTNGRDGGDSIWAQSSRHQVKRQSQDADDVWW